MTQSNDAAGAKSPRNDEVAEWLSKAEDDLRVAERIASWDDLPQFDAIAFHCQQSIEKLMKAALLSRGVVPPKVHDLPELLRRLESSGLAWDWPMTDLRTLTMAAVHARYPGFRVTSEQAFINLALTKAIWASLRPRIV